MKCSKCGNEIYIHIDQQSKYKTDDHGNILQYSIESDKRGMPLSLNTPLVENKVLKVEAWCDTCHTQYQVGDIGVMK